ncbi:MAG TPA: beta-ketoacyl synthase N-terminal-like domain-containing protein, partial [Nannocystis sp.]
LHDAGIPTDSLHGVAAGVYVGACNHDYDALQPAPADAHTLTGSLMSVLSGRLSHVLGVRGPSLTIDTACSSSLVALHLACASLRTRETDLALAGGVNLILTPDSHIRLSRMRALAPDGRCRTFDAAASGYVRGEGVGVLVLKRLGDALQSADRIWAVVRGSAVNHDGRSTGLTAPNGLSQREVIARALADAKLTTDAIDHIEAHGTGTPLGDPIEVESLRDLFSGGPPCVLGSVKTNIGHLEAAAGVAGVIKVALSLAHERIPRHLHYREHNPRIDLGTLEVARDARPWPRGPRERLAGVSSFGISGTNAHVILGEAPPPRSEPLPARSEPFVLPLSAHSPTALAQLARAWAEHLRRSDVPLADLVHTAATRRTHHAHRLAVTGTSAEELARALDAHTPSTGELATKYMHGAAIAWADVYPGRRPPAPVPRYPWQHARYWIDTPVDEPAAPPTTTPRPTSRAELEQHITAATREVLGFDAGLRIPGAQDLRDLGLDSLLALDLAVAIGRRLDMTLANSFAADYPTIAAMTDALARTLERP